MTSPNPLFNALREKHDALDQVRRLKVQRDVLFRALVIICEATKEMPKTSGAGQIHALATVAFTELGVDVSR